MPCSLCSTSSTRYRYASSKKKNRIEWIYSTAPVVLVDIVNPFGGTRSFDGKTIHEWVTINHARDHGIREFVDIRRKSTLLRSKLPIPSRNIREHLVTRTCTCRCNTQNSEMTTHHHSPITLCCLWFDSDPLRSRWPHKTDIVWKTSWVTCNFFPRLPSVNKSLLTVWFSLLWPVRGKRNEETVAAVLCFLLSCRLPLDSF
jgi:hypothetical protein